MVEKLARGKITSLLSNIGNELEPIYIPSLLNTKLRNTSVALLHRFTKKCAANSESLKVKRQNIAHQQKLKKIGKE